MSLADELRTRQPNRGQIPRMTLLLDSMSDADRAEWKEILKDRTITSAAIRRKLNKMGYSFSAPTVQNYRLACFDER